MEKVAIWIMFTFSIVGMGVLSWLTFRAKKVAQFIDVIDTKQFAMRLANHYEGTDRDELTYHFDMMQGLHHEYFAKCYKMYGKVVVQKFYCVDEDSKELDLTFELANEIEEMTNRILKNG